MGEFIGSTVVHPGIEYILHELDTMTIAAGGYTIAVTHNQDGMVSLRVHNPVGLVLYMKFADAENESEMKISG